MYIMRIEYSMILILSLWANFFMSVKDHCMLTHFPVIRSTWNLHHMKFAWLAAQNRLIKKIALSRLCERSLENHENVILANRIASSLVKMTSWDCQEGKRAYIPKFSFNSIHKFPADSFKIQYFHYIVADIAAALVHGIL